MPTDRTALVLDDSIGLRVDMLDVDRLREWARLLLVHGADISHWGSVPFVAGKMQALATDLEQTVRDVGILRAALTEPTAQAQGWQPIETAPNGYMLLLSPAHGRVIGAHVAGDVWHLVGVGVITSESERPTHWTPLMPLPAPPRDQP